MRLRLVYITNDIVKMKQSIKGIICLAAVVLLQAEIANAQNATTHSKDTVEQDSIPANYDDVINKISQTKNLVTSFLLDIYDSPSYSEGIVSSLWGDTATGIVSINKYTTDGKVTVYIEADENYIHQEKIKRDKFREKFIKAYEEQWEKQKQEEK